MSWLERFFVGKIGKVGKSQNLETTKWSMYKSRDLRWPLSLSPLVECAVSDTQGAVSDALMSPYWSLSNFGGACSGSGQVKLSRLCLGSPILFQDT